MSFTESVRSESRVCGGAGAAASGPLRGGGRAGGALSAVCFGVEVGVFGVCYQ